MADRSCMIYRAIVDLVHEGAFARFPNAVCHHLHRPIERNLRPLSCTWRAIFYFRQAPRMREQLIRRRTLWTKIPLANGTLRIALDRDQVAVLVINQLTAADAAVRTNGARNFRVVRACMHRACLVGHRLEARAVLAFANLPNKWPFRKQREHNLHPSLRGWSESQSLKKVMMYLAKPAKINAWRASH